MRLIYSPDDNKKHGKGYYWEEYKNWKTSQLFKTEEEAMQSKKENKLRWE